MGQVHRLTYMQPKYWCKFCEVFVRDTKFERQQHESTGRHQSSIRKSLRDLHRTKEREQRDSQRAKDEVARLNGIVGGGSSTAPSSVALIATTPAPTAAPKKATVEDRKRQMQQLADMGIAIPEEFRKDMAMSGEWQTVARHEVKPKSKKEEEYKQDKSLAFGVRKRKQPGNEDEEEVAQRPRKGWGQHMKSYPGSRAVDEDLDALLSEPITLKQTVSDIKVEDDSSIVVKQEHTSGIEEFVADSSLISTEDAISANEPAQDTEASEPSGGVVFKKRKKRIGT